MTRTIFAGLALVGLVAAGLVIWAANRDIVLSFREETLRQGLAAAPPFTRTYLTIFDITLEDPRIDLVEGSDRLHGGVDATLMIRLGERETPFSGAVDVSGALRYSSAEGAFYLDEPAVEAVRIAGLSETMSNRANGAITRALGEYYRTRPVYVLSTEETGQATAKLLLKDVEVKDETLIIRMGLKKDHSGE